MIIATTLLIVTLTLWMCYRRFEDHRAWTLAKKQFKGSNIRRMGVLSELWQIMYETHNSPLIHAFETAKRPDDEMYAFELCQKFWTTFSKKYINFRSVPVKVKSRWFWVEKKDFDPSKQVKQIKLNSKDDLTEFLNNSNLNKQFNPSLPYWEAYYITFVTQPKEAVGYARLHHALGDGILLNKIIAIEHEKLWPKPKRKNENNKNPKKKRKKRSVLMFYFNLVRYLPFAIKDLGSLFLFESAPKDSGIHCNYNKFGIEENSKRKFQIAISKALPLNEIKSLSKRYHGTINDFVMTVFCHALNKYIKKHVCKNEKAKYQEILKKYGEKMYLRFFTIFNMRSLLLNKKETLENSINDYANGVPGMENNLSTVPLAMPCGEMSFVERFEIIHDLFFKLKNGPTPIITMWMLQIGHFIFGLKFVNLFLGKMIATKCTFTLSNLMGPNEPVSCGDLDDDFIDNNFNVTNPTHVPSTCGIMSYCEKLTFMICSDQNAIKHPDKFMDCLHDVFQEMSSFALK